VVWGFEDSTGVCMLCVRPVAEPQCERRVGRKGEETQGGLL
jgi:hypothetical protein